MQTMRVASFGIRGAVGGSLTPETVMDFSAAFGTFLNGGKVLVGRDTRLSSGMYHASALAGLLSTGCEVLDFGICPTPVLQYSVNRYKAGGAVSISAGHVRAGVNAVTLISSQGAYIEPIGGETVLDIYHAHDFSFAAWDGIRQTQSIDDYSDGYFDALEAHLDVQSIRKCGFRVVVDPVNGAGGPLMDQFAERLGLQLVLLNGEGSGYLAHDPEPRPRNAKQVSSIMKHVRADIGFLSSSDMSRLSLVCEDGRMLSEEYTFPLIADHVLAGNPGVVVTNCCTTRMVDDIAASHQSTVVKTPVGQAYIVAALADENGVIGGEGNGSVAVPRFSRAFDAFLMMGLILETMAATGKSVSKLTLGLPEYHIVKKQVYGESRRCYRALEPLEQKNRWSDGGQMDLTDGIRVDWADGWVHARASRTEPMVRIISEFKTREQAENRANEIARMLEQEL